MMNPVIVDIHCHILFGVDDGAKDIETSLEMIKLAIAQGIESIILTPHVYSSVTRASKETQLKHFGMLKEAILNEGLSVTLHLGAEINYKSHLDIHYDKYTIEGTKNILIEFSTYEPTPIEDIVYNLIKKGYKVTIAHVERYSSYLSYSDYHALKQIGANLQVNASSILGYEAKKHKKLVKYLLKERLVDIIASDAHNTTNRAPRLKDVYDYLLKKHDQEYLDQLFYHNPKKLIES